MSEYKSMFEQAVRALAAIDEALGIGDDGCGDPEQTLGAIDDLKATAQAMSKDELQRIAETNAALVAEVSHLRGERAILRDSAKDVIAWCDKTGSGDALYCIARLRHAIAATETPNA